jgi:hypothetical protein
LATSGTSNDIAYNSATGVFSAVVAANGSSLEFLMNGTATAPQALVIEEMSIQAVTGYTATANGLLIEEQRTNLLPYSQDFSSSWGFGGATRTANATTAPDGTNNAVLLTALGNTGTASIGSIVVNATSVTYTVYVKLGNADLPTNFRSFGLYNATALADLAYISVNYATGAITSLTGPQAAGATAISQTLSNGWFRIGVTITTGITSGNTVNAYLGALGGLKVAGDTFYCWGAQLEQGAFATSYIPTVASQVTRAADNASMLGDNFATWYRQDQGTLTSSWNVSNNVSATAIEVNDGSSSNRFNIQPNTGGTTRHLGFVSGVAQIIVDITGASTGVSKDAFAYAAGDFAASRNASAVAASSYAVLPTGINQLRIGSHLSATYLNGTIRSISYYPTRLPNATLASITL